MENNLSVEEMAKRYLELQIAGFEKTTADKEAAEKATADAANQKAESERITAEIKRWIR